MKYKILSLYWIGIIGILLIINLLSTYTAFILGGVELNPFLNYLSEELVVPIEYIVGFSHIFALSALFFIVKRVPNNLISFIFIYVIAVFYIFIVYNNIHQISIYINEFI
jgi:hypothetical protein